MKNILDKFDQGSVILRLFAILVLGVVLVAGLFYAKKEREEARREIIETVKVKEEKESVSNKPTQDVQAAETAVKMLEENQKRENLTPAQEAVSKVKDTNVRANFEARIQAVLTAIEAAEQSVNQGTGTPSANAYVSYTDATVANSYTGQ